MSNFDQKAYFEKNFLAIENPFTDNKILVKIKDCMKDQRLKSVTIHYEHNGSDRLWLSIEGES